MEHLTEEELFNAVIQEEDAEMEEQEQEEQPKPPIVPGDIGDEDVHQSDWESKIRKTTVFHSLMDQNYVLNKLKMPDKAEQLDREYLTLYSNLDRFKRTPFYIIFDDLHVTVGEYRFKFLTMIGTSVDGGLSRVLSVRLSHKQRRLGATEVALDLRNLLHAGKCLKVYDNIMAVVSDQYILNTQCKKILTLPMIPDYDHLVVTVSRKFSVTETVLKGFLQDLKTNPSPDVERYLERVPQAARNFYREIMLEYMKALQRMRAHGTRDFSEANTVKLENLGRGWKGAISKACREAGSCEPTFVIRLIGLIVAEAQESEYLQFISSIL
nr:uncharacterized protein LOC108084636 [Drosophila kikkawai]